MTIYIVYFPRVRVWVLTCVYGMVSSSALALVTIVTMTLPVTWFPDHRGKVIGFIASGFGLSSTGKNNETHYDLLVIIVSSVFSPPVLPCQP